MKKFDISNTSDWRPAALVCLYSPDTDTEEGAEKADYIGMLMDDIAEWIRADYDIDVWGWDFARKNADPDGRFAHRGTCDHCGAWFLYGAAFRNAVTDETIIVGNICAQKLGLETDEYNDKLMRDRVRILKERIERDRRWNALAPNRRALLERDKEHYILCDLACKFRQWHSLSVKQWALAKKIARELDEEARELAEDPPQPIPEDLLEGRHDFEGVVLGFKREPGYWPTDPDVLKMVFKDDRGFKLYGTAPAGLFDNGYNTDGLKNARVRFAAAVARSRDDETFGFIKRPTKAVVLEEGELNEA